MTPEGKIKEKVKKLLNSKGVYFHMPVMNGMGAPTLDFICCCNGRYVAIETKAPGKKATPRQVVTISQIEEAGGYVFVVASNDDLDVLEAYLNLIGE